MKQSTFLGLNILDIVKAVFLLLLTNVVGGLVNILNSGHFPSIVELKTVLTGSLVPTVAYLLKQLVSNNQGVPLAKDVTPQVPFSTVKP
jgi:hypothetical protein